MCAPHAWDFTQRKAPATPAERAANRWKSQVRAKVEYPIGVIKRVFGFTKVCYRGLAKNRHRLMAACALANLFMVRKHLLRLHEAESVDRPSDTRPAPQRDTAATRTASS